MPHRQPDDPAAPSPAALELHIRAGEGVFIAGKRGSGKSTIASAIGGRWRRVLVYDPQFDPVALLPNAALAYGLPAALAALPGRVVYRPLPSEMDQLPTVLDELARRLYFLGAHGFVIHELGDVAQSDRELPRYLSALYRQGRMRRVPIVSVTQRPVNVPILATTQSSHYFAGYLERAADRERMVDLIGPEAAAGVPERSFEFWYKGPDSAPRRVRLPPP